MEIKDVINTESTEPEDTKPEETGKVFTQDEVNKIVENRLNRERKRLSSLAAGVDPKETDLLEREKAVTKKELQIHARASLTERGLPEGVLDFLNYESADTCKKSLDDLEKVINDAVQAHMGIVLRGGPAMKKAPVSAPDTALRSAFGLPARQ